MLEGIGGPAGNYFMLGLSHSLRASRPLYQSYCENCADDDIATYGFAVWHTMHQFPYISTCPKHGAVLRTGSGCCQRSVRNSRFARLPRAFCACATPTMPLVEKPLNLRHLDMDRAISAMLGEMLDTKWPSFSANVLSAVYRDAAVKMGFVKGRYVATKDLTFEVEGYFGKEFWITTRLHPTGKRVGCRSGPRRRAKKRGA